MIGYYTIYRDGVAIARQANVITDRGRAIILRYLAGNAGSFAGSIAAGTSPTTATTADTKLGFEFMRGAVTVAAADVPSGQIIYKATMPLNSAGKVYEIGMYPYLAGTASEYAGQLFVGFDPVLESLSGGGVNTTNYRTGAESYSVTAAASGIGTVVASQTRGNFGGYGGTDSFSLAYFINDANTASITTRLRVDTSNYFEYTITTAATSGYYVSDWAKTDFTATGTPDWENISSAEFTITAKAGGATTVQLDGLRVNDNDIYPDYALVSRTVLAEPIIKAAGEQMDIEYTLGFNV